MPMKWKKSSEALVQRFYEVVPVDPRVERRKMFGYPCAFVGGNMFMGLHQENLLLRLPEDARNEFLEQKGASIFEPMPGRKMKEYVVVPGALLRDTKGLKEWVGRALDYGSSLKPKKAGGGKKKASRR